MLNVLIPIDFSKTSYSAMSYAIEFQKEFNFSITCLHAYKKNKPRRRVEKFKTYFRSEFRLELIEGDLFSGFEMKFIDVKNDGEMPAINYYTGRPINIGDDALIMFPLFAKIRYLPFEGMIANNFSPFIEFKAGVNYSVDGNGNARTFRGRWSNAIGYGSYGGQFVVGVNFPQINGTSIITSIGFESLPMSHKVDGRDNYDGMTLNISYIFRNRN